jgi:hypothetical protein
MEFVLTIQGKNNKVFNNIFIVANKLTVFNAEMAMERKHNLYYCHDQSVADPVGIQKNDTDEIISNWKKLSPELYNSSGDLLRPQPDEKGVIKAWVPTDTKYEFESFSITLPQYAIPGE